MSSVIAPIAITNDGADIVRRDLAVSAVDIDRLGTNPDSIRSYFDVDGVLHFTARHGCKRVALQFADDLLWASRRIAMMISEEGSCQTFILADSSFSPCCVDEIAAQHADADAIVHFGANACLSPIQNRQLPVYYVFGLRTVDVERLLQRIRECSELHDLENVVIIPDLNYLNALISVEDRLPFTLAKISEDGNRRCAGLDFPGAPSGFLHIGDNDAARASLSLEFNDAAVFTYDPMNDAPIAEQSAIRRKALLRRRRYLIEKVKESQTIGIVVGTVAIDGYLTVIEHLKDIIKSSGRKSYTFAVGKPNVPKLANFPEIDIFVFMSCPMSTVLDSTDYFKDIVTPVEVDIALNPRRSPDSRYSLDFASLLDASQYSDQKIDESAQDEPRFSLITGKLIANEGCCGAKTGSDCRQLSSVEGSREVSTTGRHVQRTFHGLEPRIGQTPVVGIELGQIGNAQSYRPISKFE